jgi:hypothetical protein
MGEAKRKRQAEAVALGAVASGALIPFVSLDERAASIRLHIASARQLDAEAAGHRIQAGLELIEARRLVETGRWIEWCNANIRRSRQDIAQLIKIASATDPKAALEVDRARARNGMRASRARVCNVTYMPTPPVVVEDVAKVLYVQHFPETNVETLPMIDAGTRKPVWTAPAVRELSGAEAIIRKAYARFSPDHPCHAREPDYAPDYTSEGARVLTYVKPASPAPDMRMAA